MVGIDRMTSDAAILKNGEQVEADTLILCTGYRLSFPFLSDECRPAVLHDGMVVDGLYLHLIHATFPSMSFIGIPKKVCPLVLFDRQVRFFLATLDGTASLPSTREMLEDVRMEMEASLATGKDAQYFHTFADTQWAYYDKLAQLAGCKPLPPVVRSVYEVAAIKPTTDWLNYRSLSFKILDDKTFVQL